MLLSAFASHSCYSSCPIPENFFCLLCRPNFSLPLHSPIRSHPPLCFSVLSVIRGRISHSHISQNHQDEEQPFPQFFTGSTIFSFFFFILFFSFPVLSSPFVSPCCSVSSLHYFHYLRPLKPLFLLFFRLFLFNCFSFCSFSPLFLPTFLSLTHHLSFFSLLCNCTSCDVRRTIFPSSQHTLHALNSS